MRGTDVMGVSGLVKSEGVYAKREQIAGWQSSFPRHNALTKYTRGTYSYPGY